LIIGKEKIQIYIPVSRRAGDPKTLKMKTPPNPT